VIDNVYLFIGSCGENFNKSINFIGLDLSGHLENSKSTLKDFYGVMDGGDRRIIC
jgi:hypothetical protein